MFKKFFARKNKNKTRKAENPKFSGEDLNNSNSLLQGGKSKSPKSDKGSKKKRKAAVKKDNSKLKNVPVFTDAQDDPVDKKPKSPKVSLKIRKKKSKRPKFKKVIREKTARVVGKVNRVKHGVYPGDVDFRYTAPRTNWMASFGLVSIDNFSNQVRFLQDDTDML